MQKTQKTDQTPNDLFASEIYRLNEELEALKQERTRWTAAATRVQAQKEALEAKAADLERLLTTERAEHAAEIKRAVAAKLAANTEALTPGDRYEMLGVGRVDGVWSVSRMVVKGGTVVAAREIDRNPDRLFIPGTIAVSLRPFCEDVLAWSDRISATPS